MLIRGRCHCGNIAFSLDWQPEPMEIPARACGCSFCTAHGAVWTSNPNATLHIAVADSTLVSDYEFGTRSAQFHVCARCGVAVLVSSRIDNHLYAVVNVNTFQNVDPALLRQTAASFDSEAEDVRLARRQRFWIGAVRHVDRMP